MYKCKQSATSKTKMLKLSMAALGGISVIAIFRAIYYGYFYQPFARETTCKEIPDGSVAIALGFEYLSEQDNRIKPGQVNIFLAKKLAQCAERFSAILVQKAISDAMLDLNLLANDLLNEKAPVYQMHTHTPDIPVRTLLALKCGISRLEPLPESLVLIAHNKHYERALKDLQSIYTGHIIVWRFSEMPYRDDNPLNPFRWAFRELYLARPAEAFLRWVSGKQTAQKYFRFLIRLFGGLDCPETVKIQEKIKLSNKEKK